MVDHGSEEREGREDRLPYIGSAVIHAVAFALAAWVSAVDPVPMDFLTFQVDIVSMAPTAPEVVSEPPAVEEEELVVEEPDPTPPEPEEPAPVVEETRPREQETPPPEQARPDPTPTEEPAATEPAETEESGEDIRVRMEGLQRDYPRYYENIILQIRRCFRWRGPQNLEAQLYFVINRDGTVSDDRVVRESGNIRFDLEATAAIVDCAGQGRFGALPDDLPYDRLPVLFTFRPQG